MIIDELRKEQYRLISELTEILNVKKITRKDFLIMNNLNISMLSQPRLTLTPIILKKLIEIANNLSISEIKYVICKKCGIEFEIESDKRRFICDDCKDNGNNIYDFFSKIPDYVKKIKDLQIRNIVEQEYFINPDLSLKMSKASSYNEALSIRNNFYS